MIHPSYTELIQAVNKDVDGERYSCMATADIPSFLLPANVLDS